MIEKFFGGCQSEKNKINEIIEVINGMSEGGTELVISDTSENFYAFDIKTDFGCSATEIDIDNYSLFFVQGFGRISNLRGGSIRVCGTLKHPYNYANVFFMGNAVIYHGDERIYKDMGYTISKRYCFIDYASGEFSENDSVSFVFIGVNNNS